MVTRPAELSRPVVEISAWCGQVKTETLPELEEVTDPGMKGFPLSAEVRAKVASQRSPFKGDK